MKFVMFFYVSVGGSNTRLWLTSATIWENSSGQIHIIKAEKSQKFKSQEIRHFQQNSNNTACAFWGCERENLVEEVWNQQ